MTQKKGRNVAGSHRAKLLTLARNRGEDFQFLLGRWVVERFLYRLAGSAQKDSFVLKGAMLFLAWEGRLHRPTKDLDLLGFGSSDILDVTHRIREVCAVSAVDGIVFDLAGIQGERIKEDAEYEGVRVRVPASLDGARVSMQIDVGFGDLVEPPPAELTFPVLLPLEAPVLRAYQPETVIAEEKAVELKREMVAGQERVLWNPALSIPAKEFEFTDGEAHGLRPRLEPGMGTAWPPTAAGWNPSYTLCLARSESGSSQRPGRLRIELRNRT